MIFIKCILQDNGNMHFYINDDEQVNIIYLNFSLRLHYYCLHIDDLFSVGHFYE